MNPLVVIISKIAQSILKKLGRGSSMPGAIALKLDKNILKKFKLPKQIIAVTGSAGKGSITSTIADILKSSGFKTSHNAKGSNLTAGIVSLFLEHSNLKGEIKLDALVLEVDERYAKFIFPIVKPTYVIINNITRDQPPRQGHFDLVYEEINKALNSNMHLVLNADDPMLQKFVLNQNYKVTYYSIDKNKFSYQDNKFKNLNFIYCPNCNHKLNYNFYNFEEIGDYYCPNCSFKKPKADIICSEINYNKKYITINDKNLNIKEDTLYSIYNILASYTVTKEIGIKEENIINCLDKKSAYIKNYNLKYQNRNIYILNNKNENSSTFNQSLLFTDRDKSEKTIIIGWKEISRRYKFNDISWLYDIDFEILNKHKIDKIICVGIQKYDLAVRMKYADIENDKIIVFDNLEEATTYIKDKTKGDIFAILNFDYVNPFKELMEVEHD